jgi:sterol desaturase/sphingolipid hydroxylase (fatty acid hydroxylase superfamily)
MIDLRFGIALTFLVVILFVFERWAPLRRRTRPVSRHLLINIAVSILAFSTAMLLVRPAALAMLRWTSDAPFGVIQMIPMPAAGQFVASFLLMDLTFYWWHVANHQIPLLWRFHNVHHIDPELDVSTAFRFHFGEVALSAGFRAIQVAAIGPPAWIFLIYEIVFQANTAFHHSNIRLPIRIERRLNWVLVTPRMHGIHHSHVRDETNSNYSVVFSWWDRLHRTLGPSIPQRDIVIGVPAYSAPTDNRFWGNLFLPFRAQRDYWRRPDGTIVQRDPTTLRQPRCGLAE